MARKLTLEEGITYAIERFTPDDDDEWPRPFDRLRGGQETGRSRFVITRAIKQAFVKQHVKVVPTRVGPGPERVPDLEQRLRDRFKLRAAVVIRPSVEAAAARTPDEENDMVHRQIGLAAASFISQGAIFREGDRIAVSSGRPCYYTAHFLADGPRSKLRSIELISMSGNLKPRLLAAQPSLYMNADYNTQELARWFDNECSARYVKRHAVPHGNVRALRQTNEALSGAAWEQGVDIAIFGVGILRRGHYYHSVAQSKKDPDIEPIQKQLTMLRLLCDRFSRKDYCPVADVAHHLIFIKPSDPKWVPQEKQEQIQRLIKSVNDKTLTIGAKHLSKIRGGILLAGTVRKAAAVRHFLQAPYVRYLCTDVQLAAHVLCMPDT
jgi:DNA-binding transcriptional regulator LsrR (DeoR family)